MTATTAKGNHGNDGVVPQRNVREARTLVVEAVRPGAELQAALQARRHTEGTTPGWEFYILEDGINPCRVAFIADTAADDVPFVQVNARFENIA